MPCRALPKRLSRPPQTPPHYHFGSEDAISKLTPFDTVVGSPREGAAVLAESPNYGGGLIKRSWSPFGEACECIERCMPLMSRPTQNLRLPRLTIAPNGVQLCSLSTRPHPRLRQVETIVSSMSPDALQTGLGTHGRTCPGRIWLRSRRTHIVRNKLRARVAAEGLTSKPMSSIYVRCSSKNRRMSA